LFEVDVQVGPVDCIGDFDAWSECDKCPTHERTQPFITFAQPSDDGQACPASRVESCGRCNQLIFTLSFSDVNLDVLRAMDMSQLQAIFKDAATAVVEAVDPSAVVSTPKITLPDSRRRDMGRMDAQLTLSSVGDAASIQSALDEQMLNRLRTVFPSAFGATSSVEVAPGPRSEGSSSSTPSSSMGLLAGGAAAGLVVLVVLVVVFLKRRSHSSGPTKDDAFAMRSAGMTVSNPLYEAGTFEPGYAAQDDSGDEEYYQQLEHEEPDFLEGDEFDETNEDEDAAYLDVEGEEKQAGFGFELADDSGLPNHDMAGEFDQHAADEAPVGDGADEVPSGNDAGSEPAGDAEPADEEFPEPEMSPEPAEDDDYSEDE